MSEITELLARAKQGDTASMDRLFELLYADLRRIAHAKLRLGAGPTLLNTTALVHESYLRLAKLEQLELNDRSHFLAYAARVMRSVIVDTARARLAARRGGGKPDLTLDTAVADQGGEDAALVRVDDALADLAKVNPRLADVVEMRYFGGLTESEIGGALGVSERTVKRDWEKARLMLAAALR